jgi:hypothetical protein
MIVSAAAMRSYGFSSAHLTEEENVMPSDSELTYGQSTEWQPERPRLRVFSLVVSWVALVPALRAHPHVGWLLVRSSEHEAVALAQRGAHYLADGRVEGEDPIAPFSRSAPQHLLRTDGFQHVGDIMVGSFYDPELEGGCAFEELICLPRRARRPPDAPVHPSPVALRGGRRAPSSAPRACTASSRGGGRSSTA